MKKQKEKAASTAMLTAKSLDNPVLTLFALYHIKP